MIAAASLLEARNIGRRLPRADAWFLRDVSVHVRAGDRLAVAGPSGSGKTVFLRALALIDRLDAGTVLWKGQPVSGNAVPSFRSQVMYLHQRPALIDGTIEENLRRPFLLQVHQGKRFSRARVVGMLELLGRDETFLSKRHHELSGGEAQIVALVRAIQLDPQVLLLDEPTAALDRQATEAVQRWLAVWLDEQPARRAQLWITHDPDQARGVATRVLRMERGLLRAGPADVTE